MKLYHFDGNDIDQLLASCWKLFPKMFPTCNQQVLESFYCKATKPTTPSEEGQPVDAEMDMVALSGWYCRWRVTVQWEHRFYSSRVTGSFQQTSPPLRHLPGLFTGGGAQKKEENNKRKRRSGAPGCAWLCVFKGICFDFIKFFSWSLQKRNTLCQEEEDPMGKATTEWWHRKPGLKKGDYKFWSWRIILLKRVFSKINKEKIWNSTSHPSQFPRRENSFICLDFKKKVWYFSSTRQSAHFKNRKHYLDVEQVTIISLVSISVHHRWLIVTPQTHSQQHQEQPQLQERKKKKKGP